MTTYNLADRHEPLARLLDAVEQGEEVTITRHGIPVARIIPIAVPAPRMLGTYPISFQSDLLEPTDSDTIALFEVPEK